MLFLPFAGSGAFFKEEVKIIKDFIGEIIPAQHKKEINVYSIYSTLQCPRLYISGLCKYSCKGSSSATLTPIMCELYIRLLTNYIISY